MDFFDAIGARHSYRGPFRDAAIPVEDLHRMLDAALRAPSGHNRQTTDFIAVQSPGPRAAIAAMFPNHRGLATAPVIVVAVTRREETYKGKAFELQDFAAAVENFLLAATALGYASVWIEGALQDEGRDSRLADLLHVPAGRTVRAVLPLGVPLEPGKQAEKHPFDARVTVL